MVNLNKPNIWQIRREAEALIELSKVQEVSTIPPGIQKLDEAIKVSREMHQGKYTYEEAEELLINEEENVFQWKPFSEKQLEIIDMVLVDDPAWIHLLEGAVRSGKTISGTAAWLKFLQKSKYPRHLLTGKTKDTLFRNILSDLFDVLGEDYYYYNKAMGILQFMGKTVWCLGANDERSETRFRGPTVGSWYGDEVTTYPDSVMKMALSRPSVPGAVVIWTTNPDSPYHPIYEEYMTNEEMIKEGRIKNLHFTLDDNLTLDQRYKDNLYHSYSGVFHDRFIKGLWTIAEGAVYDMFVKQQHTFNPTTNPPDVVYEDYTVSVDYATASVCCYTLQGVYKDEEGKYHHHFLDEWYYDAKLTRKTKTDGEYSEALADFIAKNNVPVSRVFTPHDAVSLRTQFRRDGFVAVPLVSDVMNEIKLIGNLMREGRVLISEKCENLIKQVMTYVWDMKAAEKGIDAVLKKDDHAVDSMRYNIIGWLSAPRVPDLRLVRGGRPNF